MITDITQILVTFLVSVVGTGASLDWLSYLYASYRKALIRLEDEKWLHENCKDPLFFSKMRAHTSVCNEVEANFRVGAAWAAVREATDVFKLSWQPSGAALGTVCFCFALFWLFLSSRGGRRMDLPKFNKMV